MKAHFSYVSASALIGAAALAIGTLAAFPAAAQVKIGFQAPLTGPAATDGVSAKVASELAIERINAKGGILGQKAELVTYDDQAKTEDAVFTANKLIGQDGVKFAVSGSYSASGRAAAPIFQNAKVPFISAYGVHPDITRTGEYAFRTVHLGQPQGRAAAKFIGDTLGKKRISVISMDNDYGQATLEGFKSAVDTFGIKVLGEYSYPLRDRQFGSIVASVKRDNPEAVYITGYFFTGGPLVTQLRAAGITVPIIGSQAFDAQKLIEIAGPAVEGVYIVGGLNRDPSNEELKTYLADFQKRAGYPGENVGATVYSAIVLMADAINRAGTLDQAKVRDALANTKDFPHLAGKLVSFNPLREINMPMNVNIVKDGQFRHFTWIDDLKLLAPPTE
ncbi:MULTISPECIES: ABC transporter substrate-binding protein [unclassified Beijerinckia]|uniref:ABC transporter substrate-binding protein n=1 Tax=unclassified Beijerinckia TaxID=2638183 RepID=UPI00089A662F|nr:MULTISPECIES: ABC transporter substrate-binding protein [unclassified Beijerinckia]MDH7798945.1 branched-chain amino acid transport system substrate-binding protein [Beijerinckia sp. GAS462]SED86281.1 amino acid/amide ABC transporter substrate-binding protein, HAAT family [Beijerinckia sp. 28-YEA-48]